MERGLRATSAAIVYATTIGLAAAQTAPQNPGQASTARKYVVIGCISRAGFDAEMKIALDYKLVSGPITFEQFADTSFAGSCP